MVKLKRLVLFTLYWCLFPPLFFIKNKEGLEVVRRYNDISAALISTNARKRIWKLLKSGKLLSAFELFWSRWNPSFTHVTTKPVWELCGGNRHPIFATLVVFLYSGVFLHWAGFGYLWIRLAEVFVPSMGGIKNLWVIYGYLIIGTLVALAKLIRKIRHSSRKDRKTKAPH